MRSGRNGLDPYSAPLPVIIIGTLPSLAWDAFRPLKIMGGGARLKEGSRMAEGLYNIKGSNARVDYTSGLRECENI